MPSEGDIILLGRWRQQLVERLQLFRHLVHCFVVSGDNQRTEFKQPCGKTERMTKGWTATGRQP
jgi:hypothetical protein